MEVELLGIEGVGVQSRERVVLRALVDCDVGKFAVFCCRQTAYGKAAAGGVAECYWFKDLKVKAKDFVVLYSKDGTNSQKVNSSGSTSYFFYWRKPILVWTPDRLPVLVRTDDWDVGELPKDDPETVDQES